MGNIKIISSNCLIRDNNGQWIKKPNYKGKMVFQWSTFKWIVIDNKSGKKYYNFNHKSKINKTEVVDNSLQSKIDNSPQSKKKRKFKLLGRKNGS